ncbi:uncharacterized protein BDV17DRAFT_272087 [Aspergillus undulatus]|uniref:uncharacterized protein n=1 Tax=Aspergillus undulatus TaxID=1810928 RepID=UPI003CCDDFF8
MIALLLLAPFLAGQTIASDSAALKRALHLDTEAGCPADWPICGISGVCYNPDEGQICCPGGTYACPSSTFCLFDPFCCPNDQTPESCALEYGLSLPSILPTSTTSPPETTQFPPPHSHSTSNDTYASDSPSGTTEPPLYPPPTVPPTSGNSITLVSTPLPTSSVVPWPSYSVTLVSGSPKLEGVGEEPAYTGGAGSMSRGRVGGLGVVVLLVVVVGLL